MSDKVLVDKNTVNDAMLAIRALHELTGDTEYDYAYIALEQALLEAE